MESDNGPDFIAAANAIANAKLIGMPKLISEKAVSSEPELVGRSAKAAFMAGRAPAMEIVSMPKSAFGFRPIAVLSPTARVAYEALVAQFEGVLPPPSREKKFADHSDFGISASEDSEGIVVETDIAACYEYIDHSILRDELLLQSVDYSAVEALTQFLTKMYPRRVGIPQAVASSHGLADAYLSRIDRELARRGLKFSRYADDIIAIAEDEHQAFDALDVIERSARSIGLTLASRKTRVRSIRDLQRERESISSIRDGYFSRAANSLRSIQLVPEGYDDFSIEETEGAPEEIDYSALKEILVDWSDGNRARIAALSSLAPQAIRLLAKLHKRVDNELLLNIALQAPVAVRNVAAYISLRPEESNANWDLLYRMHALPRTSDWGHLWLLWAASKIELPGNPEAPEVSGWITKLTTAKSEVVRAEATWALARMRRLSVDDASRVYVEASEVTRYGVAASAGLLDNGTRSRLGKALLLEPKLVRDSYAWGESNAD